MSSGLLALTYGALYSDWLTTDGTIRNEYGLDLNIYQTDGISADQQILRSLEQSEAGLEELRLFRPRNQFYFPLEFGYGEIGDGIFSQRIESAQILMEPGSRQNVDAWRGSPDWYDFGWFAFVSRGCSGKLHKIQFEQSYFESDFPADGAFIWLKPGVLADVWLNEYNAIRRFGQIGIGTYGYI